MIVIWLRTDIEHRMDQIMNLRYILCLVWITIIKLGTWCRIVTVHYSQMWHLQMIINMVAHILSERRHFDPITDFIKHELHWLPAIERVQFKICTMVFKAVHDHSSSYISELIISSSTIAQWHDLRSSSQQVLIVPRHRTHFSEKAFAVAGPTLWNLLPVEVWNAPTLMTFRHRLKEHLFRTAMM